MYKLSRLIVLTLAIATAGCVTSEDIGAGVRTLEGQHYTQVFKRLGYPDSERTIAGNTVYSWGSRNSGTYSVPTTSTATTYVGGQAVFTTVQGSRTESYDYYCRLDVVVNSSGVVTTAEVDGNIGGCERYAALAPKKKAP